jgi:hypothetical protein
MPSYQERELLNKLDQDCSFYPVIRSLQRVLSALGLLDKVGIIRFPSGSVDTRRIIWKNSDLMVRFDGFDPTSPGFLKVLEQEVLRAVSQTPLELPGNPLPVNPLISVAQEALRLAPPLLLFKNAHETSELGSILPPSFRPLLVVTEWSTEKGDIGSYNLQLAHGLAAKGVEVWICSNQEFRWRTK